MSNINFHGWLLDRRHVLHGIGACIALPLLDCMQPFKGGPQEPGLPRRSASSRA